MHDCREYQTWLLDMDKRLKAVGVPCSASEADAFLSLHRERRAELTGRREMFDKLAGVGRNLIGERHSEADRIEAEIEATSEIQAICRDYPIICFLFILSSFSSLSQYKMVRGSVYVV